jgi:Fe-S-cluster-containing hydrogenase component 2
MNMMVNQELCKGCGDCVAVCPNEAIRLNEGKALIDQTQCTSCQACAEVCPTGALQLIKTVSPAMIASPHTMEILQTQTAMESSPKQPNWTGTLLSLAGQHLLPRMVDVLAAFLERRLSPPVQEQASMARNPMGNRPYQRRRQCRGRYSKI